MPSGGFIKRLSAFSATSFMLTWASGDLELRSSGSHIEENSSSTEKSCKSREVSLLTWGGCSEQTAVLLLTAGNKRCKTNFRLSEHRVGSKFFFVNYVFY